MEIKKQYEELRKTHSLPEFKEMDSYFEISSIEQTSLRLCDIRKKMTEKIELFSNLLEEVLHPNSDLCSLYETGFFEDNEKDKLFNLYKRLMLISRESLKLSLENNEAEDADFVKTLFKEWLSMKRDLSAMIEQLKKAWSAEEHHKFKAEYLG